MRKRKGAILSLQTTLMLIILIIFIGASAVVGFGAILDSWRLSICKTQSMAIDQKLHEYAKGHRGFRWVNKSGTDYSDENYNRHFKTRADFPMAISTDGQISSSDGALLIKGMTGYIGWEFGFTTTAKKEPYKFVYVPLDENGHQVTTASTNVVFYDLLYYDRKGNVYASPQSYRNLSTNVRNSMR